jgi:hypothetical protein
MVPKLYLKASARAKARERPKRARAARKGNEFIQ